MRFRSRRNFQRRRAANFVRRIARSAVASHHVYRFNAWENPVTITANTQTLLPLLASSDDPDYEVGGDFVTSCQCEEGALVKSIKITMNIRGSAGDTGDWLLYKDPNAVIGTTTPALLFSNAPSAAQMQIRKNALAYGAFVIPEDRNEKVLRIFVRRKALKRIGQLHEDDALKLVIDNHDASAAMSFRGYGTISVAEN